MADFDGEYLGGTTDALSEADTFGAIDGELLKLGSDGAADATPPTVTYDPPSGTSLASPGRTVSIQATDETEILRFMVSVELAPDPDTGERVWEVVYNGVRFSDKYAGSTLVTNTLTSKLMRVQRNGGFSIGENPRFEVILFDKAGNIATS